MTESETQKMTDKTEIDDGGSVYPTIDGETWTHDEGITRRDWLAGLAMQAFLQGPSCEDMLKKIGDHNYMRKIFQELTERVSVKSYEVADTMIAEGRKGE